MFTKAEKREIVHRFQVQPGLSVAIEDSLNILLEVTGPDDSKVIRSSVISNIDDLKEALNLARTWVVAAHDNAESKRMDALWDKMNPRRSPRSGRDIS